MLIVEADGAQHQDSDYDGSRDAWLIAQGYVVLRFNNTDILRHRHMVLDTIVEALEGRLEAQESAEMKFKTLSRG